MRVTKTIREYVAREIGKKFDPLINAANAEYLEERNAVIEQVRAIADRANEEAIRVVEEAGYWAPPSPYSIVSPRVIDFRDHNIVNRTKSDEAYKVSSQIRERKNKAIEDILLGLELGETTKDMLRDAIDSVVVE